MRAGGIHNPAMVRMRAHVSVLAFWLRRRSALRHASTTKSRNLHMATLLVGMA
jgi:hypothetical protein